MARSPIKIAGAKIGRVRQIIFPIGTENSIWRGSDQSNSCTSNDCIEI